MGHTASPISARYALLAAFGTVLLLGPWSSGANVGSVDAAQPDAELRIDL